MFRSCQTTDFRRPVTVGRCAESEFLDITGSGGASLIRYDQCVFRYDQCVSVCIQIRYVRISVYSNTISAYQCVFRYDLCVSVCIQIRSVCISVYSYTISVYQYPAPFNRSVFWFTEL